MAIGDGYGNNGGQNKVFDRSYYSRLKFRKDNLALNFTYSGGLLSITIDERDDANGSFKYNNLQKISLSPYKAKMFVEEIKKFKEYVATGDINPTVAFGVNAGINANITYIGVHADLDGTPKVTIGKFNNDGIIIEQATFTFNKDYNYALEWKNIDTNDLTKVYYNNLEIDMFENIVTNFANNIDGAIAYSVHDLGRYDYNRLVGRFDVVYKALNIPTYGEAGNYSQNTFLQNSSATQSTSTSIDDIME